MAGRILDQLSPTAWLPAALLVSDVAVAFAYAQSDGSAGHRWREIGGLLDSKPLGVILGALFALAAVTIMTQSLGFAAIRFFEGYWGSSWWTSHLAALGIRLQDSRRRRLTELGEELDQRALLAALPFIDKSMVDKPLQATAIARRARGLATSTMDEEVVAEASRYIKAREWLAFAPASLLHRISAVDELAQRFPAADRMMPTRLGLALRTAEDQLTLPAQEGDLRGYVIRHLAEIDARILAEHDEHRNRLDMYAVLCAVCLFAIPANLLLLWQEVQTLTLVLLSLAGLVLALTSYKGAVSSAEEYGQALIAVDKALTDGQGGRWGLAPPSCDDRSTWARA